jgi:putative membrane protein
VTALVLGLIKAFVGPALRLLTCPFILLTLGVFLLVVNAFTL